MSFIVQVILILRPKVMRGITLFLESYLVMCILEINLMDMMMEYKIIGGSFPAVVCTLESGETMVTERGSMVWMSPNIDMQTKGGGLGKMFSRAAAGESMFQNIYTAQGKGMITFGASFPGCIKVFDITPGRDVILQKMSLLAMERGVDFSIHFNQRLSTGLFGGEGFIMQRFSGRGTLFAEVAGHLVEYNLAPGQQLLVDTGNVVGFEPTVDMSIRQVKGFKNKLLGGEGIFNTLLTGPGKVWVQTMSIEAVANSILPYIPTGNG